MNLCSLNFAASDSILVPLVCCVPVMHHRNPWGICLPSSKLPVLRARDPGPCMLEDDIIIDKAGRLAAADLSSHLVSGHSI